MIRNGQSIAFIEIAWDPARSGYEPLPVEWGPESVAADGTVTDKTRWECDSISKAKWMKVRTTAAAFSSSLLTLYPHLKGFVMNDLLDSSSSAGRPCCLYD